MYWLPRSRHLLRSRRPLCRAAYHPQLKPLAALSVPPPAKRPGLRLHQGSKAKIRRQNPPHLQRRKPPPCRSQARRVRQNLRKKSVPKLANWAEQNIPEGLTAFSFPEASRQRPRTSNMCEKLNSQIKRRTRVVGLFPNEFSLLRPVTGVHVEISEEWQTSNPISNPKPKNNQTNLNNLAAKISIRQFHRKNCAAAKRFNHRLVFATITARNHQSSARILRVIVFIAEMLKRK